MLTDASYQYAIYAYVGSALLALLCFGWWLSWRWRPGWVAVVVCVLAALLLTPAFPNENAETLAPALIVVGFQFFVYGYEEAESAIRALATFSGAALVFALLFWVIFLRGRTSRQARRLARADEQAGQGTA
ncbi:MAG: hypothetical protein ACPG1A_10215 [Halioglobus sp.]